MQKVFNSSCTKQGRVRSFCRGLDVTFDTEGKGGCTRASKDNKTRGNITNLQSFHTEYQI